MGGVISMFFVPAPRFAGRSVDNVRLPGASFVRTYDVIARTPGQEKLITGMIKDRIGVLFTGGGAGEEFNDPDEEYRPGDDNEEGMTKTEFITALASVGTPLLRGAWGILSPQTLTTILKFGAFLILYLIYHVIRRPLTHFPMMAPRLEQSSA